MYLIARAKLGEVPSKKHYEVCPLKHELYSIVEPVQGSGEKYIILECSKLPVEKVHYSCLPTPAAVAARRFM